MAGKRGQEDNTKSIETRSGGKPRLANSKKQWVSDLSQELVDDAIGHAR